MLDSTQRFNQLMEAMHKLHLENNDLQELLQKLQGGMPMDLRKQKQALL
jgi:hypothetical protein